MDTFMNPFDTLTKLVELVSDMRNAQRRYFKEKDKDAKREWLLRSKDLERKVDGALREITAE